MSLLMLKQKITGPVLTMRRSFSLCCKSFSAVLICAALSNSAWAGFQWKQPEEPPVVPLGPGQGAAKEAPTQLPTLSEAPAKGAPPAGSKLEPVPLTPVAPLQVIKTPQPSAPDSKKPAVTPPVGAAGTDVAHPLEGFARDIPLVVALKQVLPNNYGFTLDKNVSSATSVSWEGGEVWRNVLQSMLAKAGLGFHEEGLMVKIHKTGLDGKATDAPSTKPMVAEKAEKEKMPVVAKAAPAPVKTDPAVKPNATKKSQKSSGHAPKIEPLELQLPTAAPVIAKASQPATKASAASKKRKDQDGIAATALPAKPVMKKDMASLPPPPTPAAAGKIVSDHAATNDNAALPGLPPGEFVAPAMPLSKLQPVAAEVWTAEPGQRLHNVIKEWCARANVELVWSTEYDYPIQASMSFSGSFEDAVRGLLTGFVEAKPQPYGRLHDNPSVGQRTLVIEARGNVNND